MSHSDVLSARQALGADSTAPMSPQCCSEVALWGEGRAEAASVSPGKQAVVPTLICLAARGRLKAGGWNLVLRGPVELSLAIASPRPCPAPLLPQSLPRATPREIIEHPFGRVSSYF